MSVRILRSFCSRFHAEGATYTKTPFLIFRTGIRDVQYLVVWESACEQNEDQPSAVLMLSTEEIKKTTRVWMNGQEMRSIF